MLGFIGAQLVACDLATYVTSASTIIGGTAAAVVLILRELRYKHPMDTPPTTDDPDGTKPVV